MDELNGYLSALWLPVPSCFSYASEIPAWQRDPHQRRNGCGDSKACQRKFKIVEKRKKLKNIAKASRKRNRK